MQSTVTSKGQITIPIAIRRSLKLRTGDVLDFDAKAPFLKASKKVDRARMKSTLGRGKNKLRGKTSKEWVEYLRGPADWSW